jgi:ADP-heptose:LPS heptosyltransferase
LGVHVTQGKILVIRGGAIGDFILTLPVLAALRAQFPSARLEVLGYPHIAQLALVGGLVDAVRSIEARPLAGFFARGGKLDMDLVQYFESFAVIVSYLYDPDGIFQTNVRACTKAQFLVGSHRPNEAGGEHATQVFLKPLERLAIFSPDPVPRLALTPPPSTPKPLALHPGSGSEKKNWPESRWAGLLKRLIDETRGQLLLVTGEAEAERVQRLAVVLPPGRFEVVRNPPLTELALRFGRCAAFVGHDSGISHLAAAVGLPGLVLWGDSVEAVWRPLSEKVILLRQAGGLNSLSVDRVFAELSRILRETLSPPAPR